MTVKLSLETRRANALIERRRLILRLRAVESDETRNLADILDACTTQHPCHSAACPVCGITFQLAAVALQERVIGIPARAVRNRKHALTIVPGSGCVPPNSLSLEVYLWIRCQIEAALIACDLPPNMFSLDVSFNDDLTGRLPPHWCIHGDGIGVDWAPKEKVDALRKVFPKTYFVSKPVLHQMLDHEEEALLYAYKPERFRRETQPREIREDGQNSRPKPKPRSLRPWQSITLALVEHAAGYRGRLIGHKIDQSALDELMSAFEWARDGP